MHNVQTNAWTWSGQFPWVCLGFEITSDDRYRIVQSPILLAKGFFLFFLSLLFEELDSLWPWKPYSFLNKTTMGHEKYVPRFPLLDLSFISSAVPVLLLLAEKIKADFVSRFDGLDLIIYTIFSPITQTLDKTTSHPLQSSP